MQESREGDDYEEVEQTAKMLRDMLNEAMSSVRIACGTIVGEIRQVSRSYKEAKDGARCPERSFTWKNRSLPTTRWALAA